MALLQSDRRRRLPGLSLEDGQVELPGSRRAVTGRSRSKSASDRSAIKQSPQRSDWATSSRWFIASCIRPPSRSR